MKYRVEKFYGMSLPWIVRDPTGRIVWHSTSHHGAFHMAEIFAGRRDLHEDLDPHPL